MKLLKNRLFSLLVTLWFCKFGWRLSPFLSPPLVIVSLKHCVIPEAGVLVLLVQYLTLMQVLPIIYHSTYTHRWYYSNRSVMSFSELTAQNKLHFYSLTVSLQLLQILASNIFSLLAVTCPPFSSLATPFHFGFHI